ncbi:hypothetical protein M501DRAFT_1020896 [Patellaria atrata CBS 101060]|uniref:Autophagy protein n=1 Tax=Patellaria atrata CBS 101060 TaxID=1346257 RepID=A0A9P4VIQ5_9PEZI|nr:hypothetical protein M501DRAFT_1020896 [Patellaria atrata CBS 101060]
MGWLWDSTKQSKASQDPVKALDPSLQEFLTKESPSAYTPSTPAPPSPPPTVKPIEFTKPPQSDTSNSPPVVPRESLFQDGRYAHLWKGYESLSTVEGRGKSDNEKLKDVVDAYNDRKVTIGRLAQENCALEMTVLNECWKSWTIRDKLTLCRTEQRSMNRCFEMQSKFMKALGYMSMVHSTEEDRERIQMHADKLYHQMLEQERIVREAEEKGLPSPEFKPVMSKENIAVVMGLRKTEDATIAAGPARSKLNIPDSAVAEMDVGSPLLPGIAPERRREFFKSLEGKSVEERELEIRAMEQEVATVNVLSKGVSDILSEEKKAREERIAAGKAGVGDYIKKWWGW